MFAASHLPTSSTSLSSRVRLCSHSPLKRRNWRSRYPVGLPKPSSPIAVQSTECSSTSESISSSATRPRWSGVSRAAGIESVITAPSTSSMT